MEVREATLADVSELVRLNDEVQRLHAELYPQIYIYPLEVGKVSRFFDDLINSESASVLVATSETGLCGYLYYEIQLNKLNAFKFPSTRYYIHHVSVEKKSRRNGVATQLFQYLESTAKSVGNTQVMLDTMHLNRHAQQFFESIGFSLLMQKYSKSLT